MGNHRNITIHLLLVVFAGTLFIPFLGGVHLFDWDEINFAESAREMIITNNFLSVSINFHPFWEKPPLFIWFQVLSMKLFGINEFAARFPNAVCGMVTLPLLFHIGRTLYDEKFGLIWVLAYAGSILPFLYYKSGIIDPWFNLFIFSGIYCFIRYTRDRRILLLLLSAAFIGLGILTKGPVALLIFFLAAGIFRILNRQRLKISGGHILLFLVVLFVTGGFWFILQLLRGNADTVKEFILYQVRLFRTEDAGHGGFLFYHFLILFFGVYPASVFALNGFRRNRNDTGEQAGFRKWMLILFWTVLILFTVVKTKIVHYSSLCYFPLTYLASTAIYQCVTNKRFPVWIRWTTTVTGIFIAFAVISIPLLGIYTSEIIGSGIIRDKFAVAALTAGIHWTGFESITVLFLLTGLTGFIFLSRRRKIFLSTCVLFGASILFIYSTLIVFTPRIEAYSQRPAIEFFRSHSNEDAYIETLGYKSYAHLFYGDKKPLEDEQAYSREWLLTGPIDKKAYFSSKITDKDAIQKKYPQLKLLYEKKGFVFWERFPG